MIVRKITVIKYNLKGNLRSHSLQECRHYLTDYLLSRYHPTSHIPEVLTVGCGILTGGIPFTGGILISKEKQLEIELLPTANRGIMWTRLYTQSAHLNRQFNVL